jgi:hypothetical protein
LKLTRLDPASATLRWRGFSAEVKPDGREPLSYDYTRVSLVSPWLAFTGSFTREGDVRELLKVADDMFVVSRAGDEISLSFDASTLPALPEGWTRTFLLYADGFSKEMNIHSASPEPPDARAPGLRRTLQHARRHPPPADTGVGRQGLANLRPGTRRARQAEPCTRAQV